MREGALERRVREDETAREQRARDDTLTGEDRPAGHFSKRELQCKRGSRNEGRPMQHLAEEAREFRVLRRIGCHEIRWPLQRRITHRMLDAPNHVTHGYPAHPLSAGAKRTTGAQ